jgi:hypothetical protein
MSIVNIDRNGGVTISASQGVRKGQDRKRAPIRTMSNETFSRVAFKCAQRDVGGANGRSSGEEHWAVKKGRNEEGRDIREKKRALRVSDPLCAQREMSYCLDPPVTDEAPHPLSPAIPDLSKFGPFPIRSTDLPAPRCTCLHVLAIFTHFLTHLTRKYSARE